MFRNIFFVFCFAAVALAQSPGDYFPLQVGNQWVYRSTGAIPGQPLTIAVEGTRTVGGEEYFVVQMSPGEQLLLRYNPAGTLVFRADGQEKPWVAFGANTGEAFATAIDPCNATAVIRTRNARVESPVGPAGNGLEVAYRPPAQCADTGLISETFVPWVGLVERRATTIAGEQVYRLIHVKVGNTVLTEPDLAFSMSLDKAVYGPGERLTMRLSLRATEGRGIRLVMPSSQDYDLSIRDAEGRTVYTWSADKSFLAVIREFDVLGERSWLLVTPLPALPPGLYSATGRLASSPGFEATMPLRIGAAR